MSLLLLLRPLGEPPPPPPTTGGVPFGQTIYRQEEPIDLDALLVALLLAA